MASGSENSSKVNELLRLERGAKANDTGVLPGWIESRSAGTGNYAPCRRTKIAGVDFSDVAHGALSIDAQSEFNIALGKRAIGKFAAIAVAKACAHSRHDPLSIGGPTRSNEHRT